MSVIELKKIFKKVLTLTKVLCIIKHVAKITKEIKSFEIRRRQALIRITIIKQAR